MKNGNFGTLSARLRSLLPNLALSLAVLLVCLEAMSFVYARFVEPNVPRPTYSLSSKSGGFWGDINKDFGVWHYPNVKNYLHSKQCFGVRYSSNSYGARDVERPLKAEGKRIVALGDSFIEGWGLADGQRFTDLLEADLKVPILNFGCSGVFGPPQYWLLYSTMAKKFDHSLVLVGILPDNDFLDMDFDYGKRNYKDRYRPYLTGTYPGYKVTYSREFDKDGRYMNTGVERARRFLRDYSYLYNVAEYVKMLRRSMHAQDLAQSAQAKKEEKVYSGYYDFKPEQYDMLRYSIERIVEEAAGRKVVVVTLPRLNDFIRYEEGPPVLPGMLAALAKEKGFDYMDLLPAMYNADRNYRSFFFDCDRHWGPYGAQTAARVFSKALAGYLEGAN